MKSDFKKYRQAARLTQEEIAKKLGFSSTFPISKFDAGTQNISDVQWVMFLQICKERVKKDLEDIEADIEESKKKIFGDDQ